MGSKQPQPSLDVMSHPKWLEIDGIDIKYDEFYMIILFYISMRRVTFTGIPRRGFDDGEWGERRSGESDVPAPHVRAAGSARPPLDALERVMVHLTRREFEARYGTEEQCHEALHRWRWPNGFRCPHCGHDRSHRLTYRALDQCVRCRRQTSVTSGTVLDSTKIPLRDWFLGLYYMTADQRGVTAMALHRHLGISYNAAWRMRRKLLALMTDRRQPLHLD